MKELHNINVDKILINTEPIGKMKMEYMGYEIYLYYQNKCVGVIEGCEDNSPDFTEKK